MGHVWLTMKRSRLGVYGCLALFVCALCGCGGGSAPPQPDAEVRLAKLLHLYQAYVQKNQKGPPSEEVLREFGKGLSAKEQEDFAIGDDIENIFTSPRDNQKFVVQYNTKIDPSRARAFIWEATGQGGMRFVALTNFYIVQYDESQLAEAKK
jgi:hypothetical protein